MSVHLVQFNYFDQPWIVKVRVGRIIERDVTVFSDTRADNIRRVFTEQGGIAVALFFSVACLGIKQIHLFQRDFRKQALPINLIVMGWINLAMIKILTLILGVDKIVAIYVCIGIIMESIANARKFLIALGAGTGLVYIHRWFWWRINAWSEVAAMASAFVVSLVLQYGFHMSSENAYDFAYLVLITTVVWIAATYLTKPEPDEILLTFYRKVRPSAKFWKPIAQKAPEIQPVKDGIAKLYTWFLGCVMIYTTLFGFGKIIFEEYSIGCLLLFAAGLSFYFIYWDLSKRGWESLTL